jgi:hypothetical protein
MESYLFSRNTDTQNCSKWDFIFFYLHVLTRNFTIYWKSANNKVLPLDSFCQKVRWSHASTNALFFHLPAAKKMLPTNTCRTRLKILRIYIARSFVHWVLLGYQYQIIVLVLLR